MRCHHPTEESPKNEKVSHTNTNLITHVRFVSGLTRVVRIQYVRLGISVEVDGLWMRRQKKSIIGTFAPQSDWSRKSHVPASTTRETKKIPRRAKEQKANLGSY